MFIPKHSKWMAPSGRVLEVVGIWARGAGCHYEPVAYELQDGQKINQVERAVLVELITTKKLKRYD